MISSSQLTGMGWRTSHTVVICRLEWSRWASFTYLGYEKWVVILTRLHLTYGIATFVLCISWSASLEMSVSKNMWIFQDCEREYAQRMSRMLGIAVVTKSPSGLLEIAYNDLKFDFSTRKINTHRSVIFWAVNTIIVSYESQYPYIMNEWIQIKIFPISNHNNEPDKSLLSFSRATTRQFCRSHDIQKRPFVVDSHENLPRTANDRLLLLYMRSPRRVLNFPNSFFYITYNCCVSKNISFGAPFSSKLEGNTSLRWRSHFHENGLFYIYFVLLFVCGNFRVPK